MADGTGIEWTDASWNVVTGCEFESPGCANCYAMRMARRLDGQGKGYDGTTRMTKSGPVWSGKVNLHPDRLEIPLRWRKPRRVFPCSMSDLFHPDVPFLFIAAVYGIMCYAERHTFQVLTKRAERAAEFYEWIASPDSIRFEADADGEWPLSPAQRCLMTASALAKARWNGPMFGLHLVSHIKPEPDAPITKKWPLPNVWLGVSVEDQRRADERIPHLLRCPAAVRFLSCEPLLGPTTVRGYLMQGERPGRCAHCGNGHGFTRCPNYGGIATTFTPPGESDPVCRDFRRDDFAIGWVIVGGESGPGARPMHPSWVRSLRDQCADAGVPFFFKQWGAWAPHGSAALWREGGREVAGEGVCLLADGRTLAKDLSVADLRRRQRAYEAAGGRGRLSTRAQETDLWPAWCEANRRAEREGELAWPWSTQQWLYRVGKKAAGRLLDGREWNQFPEVAHA